MRSLVVVAMLATTARAQAPGAIAPQPPSVSRWAIGLALGIESATPNVDNAAHAGFGLIELSGRFRFRPEMEVVLTLDGGSDNNAGQVLATGGAYADFRYRFFADRAWNVIALAGLGIASIGPKDGTDTQKQARGSVRIGGGVERRFGQLALEADLRLFAIAQNTNAVSADGVIDTASELARNGVSGISLTIGAAYYF